MLAGLLVRGADFQRLVLFPRQPSAQIQVRQRPGYHSSYLAGLPRTLRRGIVRVKRRVVRCRVIVHAAFAVLGALRVHVVLAL